MEITYDPVKNERNVRERGLSFDRACEFDFHTAACSTIFRNGEQRELAVGFLDGRLHVLCYKQTPGGIRVISFRKANEREAAHYGLELRR